MASVKLLEGNSITVKLTGRGYAVEPDKRIRNYEDDSFETVESLLQSVSREYEKRRHEAWVKELEKLLTVSSRDLP